jgi:hypothetical protein
MNDLQPRFTIEATNNPLIARVIDHRPDDQLTDCHSLLSLHMSIECYLHRMQQLNTERSQAA